MASLVVFPFWMVSLVGLSRRDSLDNESDAPLPSWMGFGDLRIAVFMGLLGGMWGVL
ncbi:MAG TPA: hypothetical protein PK765_03975 [bacterium]|nr:hypothetical protein [bacterium]